MLLSLNSQPSTLNISSPRVIFAAGHGPFADTKIHAQTKRRIIRRIKDLSGSLKDYLAERSIG
jgi:hypothetical protein